MRPLNILFIIIVPPSTFNGDEITLLKLELISKRLFFVDPSAALKLNFVKKRKSKVYYVFHLLLFPCPTCLQNQI